MNTQAYGKLLMEALPGVINSDEEYNRTEEIFFKLIKKERSPEEDRLFDLLANLMEDYEKRNLLILPEGSPIGTLKFLMEENELTQNDLAELFGGQPVVSDILNGKRQINANQAKRLGERFRVSPALFI